MADKENVEKTQTVHIPISKKHQILQDVAQQLQGTYISEDFEVVNHKYLMRTLTADEELWGDTYGNASSHIATFTSLRVPRLAASIKAIDGVPVNQLFDFDDNIPEAEKAYHSETPTRKRYWEMNQMLLWLGSQPNNFILELWRHYTTLIERRDKSWDEIKKSSARTPGGG